MTSRRVPLAVAFAAASVLVLSGCTAADEPVEDDGRIAVVTSTNVYGQIVDAIGGDLVSVTSIIDSPAQDPHAFEPSAQDQLAVSKADLVVENGGGYDTFIDGLIESSGTTAEVVTAVEFSPAWPADAEHAGSTPEASADEHGHEHIAGFNEHVWYDVETVAALADELAAQLEKLNPSQTATFAANLAAFQASLAPLATDLAAIAAAHSGDDAFVTEPVSLYLVEDAGLDDITPDAFVEASENGYDIPPATLLEALHLLESGTVDVMVANSQTGGPQTLQVIEEADAQGIPVVEFTETLPEGQTYVSWMLANITALQKALDS